MPNNSHRGIRTGPGRFEWNDLLHEQQEGILRAAELLAEMVSAADAARSENATQKSAWMEQPTIQIERRRSTNVLLMDGTRGIGKTTAALNLLHRIGQDNRGEATPFTKALEERGIDYDQLERIFPIGIIDARPLPKHTPPGIWLTHPVVALAKELAKNEPQCTSLEAAFNDDSLDACRRSFLQRLAGGWSGRTISDRELPDMFANEVAEREDLRYNMRSSWHKLIEKLVARLARRHRAAKRPVLLTLVDDVDMSFHRTTEILELVRLFSHPHVAYLLTGHTGQLIRSLRIQLAADVSAPFVGRDGSAWGDSILATWSRREIAQLSEQIIEKLIPVSRRIRMRELDADSWLRWLTYHIESVGHPDVAVMTDYRARMTSLVETVAEFPGALDSLSPRTVRSTEDLGLVLANAIRAMHRASNTQLSSDSQRDEQTVGRTLDALNRIVGPWLERHLDESGGSGFSFRRIRNGVLVLSQDLDAIRDRAEVIRSRTGLENDHPIFVPADRTIPPQLESHALADMLIAHGLIADDLSAVAIRRAARSGWAPVWVVSPADDATPAGNDFELTRWPGPPLIDVGEFRRYFALWEQHIPDNVHPSLSLIDKLCFAYLYAACNYRLDGREKFANRDSTSSLLRAIGAFLVSDPEDVDDRDDPELRRQLARTVTRLLAPSSKLPEAHVKPYLHALLRGANDVRSDSHDEALRKCLSPHIDAGDLDATDYFIAWASRHATWTAVLQDVVIPSTSGGPSHASKLHLLWSFGEKLGSTTELNQFIRSLSKIAPIESEQKLLLQLEALTDVGVDEPIQREMPRVETRHGVLDVRMPGSESPALWVRRGTKHASWESPRLPGSFVRGVELLQETTTAVRYAHVFEKVQLEDAPIARGMRSAAPCVVGNSELGLGPCARFLVASDIGAVAGFSKESPHVDDDIPVAGHTLRRGRKNMVVVPWYAPRFRTGARFLALNMAMERVLGTVRDLESREDVSPQEVFLFHLLSALPFAGLGWPVISQGEVVLSIGNEKLKTSLKQVHTRVGEHHGYREPELQRSVVRDWFRTELPLWLAPEYCLPQNVATAILEWYLDEEDSPEVNWPAVFGRRESRLDEIRTRWSFGENDPQTGTLQTMIEEHAGRSGAWDKVEKLALSASGEG